MKRFLAAICIFALSAVMMPFGAVADLNVLAGNMVRFDVSEEEFCVLGEKLFDKMADDSDDLNHLNTFPVLPELMMKLADEFGSNSSTLEKTEYSTIWRTEAAKIVYDERMLGVKVWAEFGSTEKKLEIDETNIDGKDGTVWLILPEEYAFGEISALRIEYEPWNGGQFNFGNARFDLTYFVSDGAVICDSVEVILEYGGYCMAWWLKKTESSGRPILNGLFENLQNDAYWSGGFDMVTGERFS